MKAIVKKKDKTWYVSTVFADCDDGNHEYDFTRYFVILNEDKTQLTVQRVFEQPHKNLEPVVIPLDNDHTDWVFSDKWHGYYKLMEGLRFDELALVPPQILKECIRIDAETTYNPYPEIHTRKDVEDLETMIGSFHDSHVKTIEQKEDTIYVVLDGLWGLELEMWFSGHAGYNLGDEEDRQYYYWQSGDIYEKDGAYYLADTDYLENLEKINKCYWIKGDHVKYHIVPTWN